MVLLRCIAINVLCSARRAQARARSRSCCPITLGFPGDGRVLAATTATFSRPPRNFRRQSRSSNVATSRLRRTRRILSFNSDVRETQRSLFTRCPRTERVRLHPYSTAVDGRLPATSMSVTARRRTRFEPISTQTSVCCRRFVRGGVRLSSPRALPREDRRGDDGVDIVLDRQEKGK